MASTAWSLLSGGAGEAVYPEQWVADLGSGSPDLTEVVGNRWEKDRMGRWGGDMDVGVEMGAKGAKGAEIGARYGGVFSDLARRGEEPVTADRSPTPEVAATSKAGDLWRR